MKEKEIARSIRSFKGPGIIETVKEIFTGFSRPFDTVQVEVSTRCPSKCLYCPRTVFKESWADRDIMWETYTKLFTLFRKSNRVHLQGWGEPFLNPDFFHMVKLALKAGAQVSTTTCGTLMNEKLAEEIVKSGIDIIAFSLTGTDNKSSHMRKGADFNKVCESIKLLQSVRKKRCGVHLEVYIAYLLLWSDRGAVLKLPDLMKELGVHGAVVSTLDFVPSKELEKEAVEKTDLKRFDEMLKIIQTTEKMARNNGVDLHFSNEKSIKEEKGCSENIERSLFISSDGSVSPCVLTNINGLKKSERRVFGNVNSEDIMDIINKKEFLNFKKRLKSEDPDSACAKCPKRYS